jgi:hypothetical protein
MQNFRESGSRQLICEAQSPDGRWQVCVFGASQYDKALYGHASLEQERWWCTFGMGREEVVADRITFKWDLPNGAWGIFIDGDCWAVCSYRSALRMHRQRMYSRAGPRAKPFSPEEIKFMCAKRRGQRPGSHGFVIEE